MYWLKGNFSFGHRLGNWISDWCTLADSLLSVITLGFFQLQLTWKWMEYRLFTNNFFYDTTEKIESEIENGI